MYHYIYIISFLVVIDSGSRYEVAYPSGVSHFLEKLAFHVCISVSIKSFQYVVYLLFTVYVTIS